MDEYCDNPHLCIYPVCATSNCSDCNCTLTPEQVRQFAKRYAYLRGRSLDAIKDGGVFAGLTPDNVVLNGDDLDAAIDGALTLLVNTEGKRPAQGTDAGPV
jgi:hypothetical protein